MRKQKITQKTKMAKKLGKFPENVFPKKVVGTRECGSDNRTEEVQQERKGFSTQISKVVALS